jgi:hypothetical protein
MVEEELVDREANVAPAGEPVMYFPLHLVAEDAER